MTIVIVFSCEDVEPYKRQEPLSPTIKMFSSWDTLVFEYGSSTVYYNTHIVLGFYSSRDTTRFAVWLDGPDLLNDIGEKAWIHDVPDVLKTGKFSDTTNGIDFISYMFRRPKKGESGFWEWGGFAREGGYVTIDSLYEYENRYYLSGEVTGVLQGERASLPTFIEFSIKYQDIEIREFL